MRGPYFAVVGRAVLQIVIIPFSLDFGPLRRRLCGVYGKLMFCLQIAFVVLGVYLSDLLEKLSERFDPSPIIAQELRGLTQFVIGLAARKHEHVAPEPIGHFRRNFSILQSDVDPFHQGVGYFVDQRPDRLILEHVGTKVPGLLQVLCGVSERRQTHDRLFVFAALRCQRHRITQSVDRRQSFVQPPVRDQGAVAKKSTSRGCGTDSCPGTVKALSVQTMPNFSSIQSFGTSLN